MKSALLVSACLTASVSAFLPTSSSDRIQQHRLSSGLSDLETIATKSNPVLKFYDPLQLSTVKLWGDTQDNSIAFLRHAEIK